MHTAIGSFPKCGRGAYFVAFYIMMIQVVVGSDCTYFLEREDVQSLVLSFGRVW